MRLPIRRTRTTPRWLWYADPLVSADVLVALTPAQMFGSMAVQVNGPRCWDERITVDLDLGDDGRFRLRLANGVLTHTTAAKTTPPDVTLWMPRTALPTLIMGGSLTPENLAELSVEVDGDFRAVARLLAARRPGPRLRDRRPMKGHSARSP